VDTFTQNRLLVIGHCFFGIGTSSSTTVWYSYVLFPLFQEAPSTADLDLEKMFVVRNVVTSDLTLKF